MSNLQLAVAAGLPVIAATTRDPANFPEVIRHITGADKLVPWKHDNDKYIEGTLYYTNCVKTTNVVNLKPWLDQGRLQLLSEAPAGIGRLYQHATSHPFIMLSASRRTSTSAENKSATIALLKLIRESGLGAIQVEGHYVEDTGSVTEVSFFVPLTGRSNVIRTGDELLAAGTRWGNMFHQESLLYGDMRHVYRVRCDTGDFVVLSTTAEITTHNLTDAFSRLRNQEFTFRSPVVERYQIVGYRVPTGYISALGMSRDGLWPESKRY